MPATSLGGNLYGWNTSSENRIIDEAYMLYRTSENLDSLPPELEPPCFSVRRSCS